MHFDGSGNFVRDYPVGGWQGDAGRGTMILALNHDTHDGGLADGLSMMICKDGQSTILNDIPWNGKKITGLAPGVNPTDATNMGQLTSLRSFSSAIHITGAHPEARVVFDGTTGPWGLSFPAASVNGISYGVRGETWVWNDKADFSGTDLLTLVSNPDAPALTLLSKTDTTNGPVLYLRKESPTPALNDFLGGVYFSGKNSAAETVTYGRMYTAIADPVNASEDGTLYLSNMVAGTLTNRLTLGSSGVAVTGTLSCSGTLDGNSNMTISGTGLVSGNFTTSGSCTADSYFISSDGICIVSTTGNGTVYLRPGGSSDTLGEAYFNTGDTYFRAAEVGMSGNLTVSGTGYIGRSAVGGYLGTSLNAGSVYTSSGTTSSTFHSRYYNPNGQVGSITTAALTTGFNTSSDENLKDFIGNYDPAEAIAIIRADPVREYTWKQDGSHGIGWGAQTSHAIDPALANPPPEPLEGEARSNEPGDPDYAPWSIDYGRRTPYLWAALAAALDKIDALEARLAALEAA